MKGPSKKLQSLRFKRLREILFVVQMGSDIIKPDNAQNKQTTFSMKNKIGIELESLRNAQKSSLIKVFSDLKNEHVWKC